MYVCSRRRKDAWWPSCRRKCYAKYAFGLEKPRGAEERVCCSLWCTSCVNLTWFVAGYAIITLKAIDTSRLHLVTAKELSSITLSQFWNFWTAHAFPYKHFYIFCCYPAFSFHCREYASAFLYNQTLYETISNSVMLSYSLLCTISVCYDNCSARHIFLLLREAP